MILDDTATGIFVSIRESFHTESSFFSQATFTQTKNPTLIEMPGEEFFRLNKTSIFPLWTRGVPFPPGGIRRRPHLVWAGVKSRKGVRGLLRIHPSRYKFWHNPAGT